MDRAAEGEIDWNERYLQLIAACRRFLPGHEIGSPAWVSPPQTYALMDGVNQLLLSKLRDDPGAPKSTDFTHIGRAKLKRDLRVRARWSWTDPQLENALNKFVMRGYLSRQQNTFVVLPPLVNLLCIHANDLYKAVLSRPQAWPDDNFQYLAFNALVFNFFHDVLAAWRQIRTAINEEFARSGATAGKRSYFADYSGQHPEYMLVLYAIGFSQRTYRTWDLFGRIHELSFGDFVKSPGDVDVAINALHERKILYFDDEQHLTLAPKFAAWVREVIEEVKIHLPELERASANFAALLSSH